MFSFTANDGYKNVIHVALEHVVSIACMDDDSGKRNWLNLTNENYRISDDDVQRLLEHLRQYERDKNKYVVYDGDKL